MKSEAMKKEIEAVGHGYKANCWCTHGCWIMSSITFNPGKMISMLIKSNRETKKLNRPVDISEPVLAGLEDKYSLDRGRLRELGIA
jgi:hypothetical protein